MKRLAARLAVVLFSLVLCLAAFASPGAQDTPDQIKARVQKNLDAVAAKPSPRVLVIPIEEEIDLPTAVYVEREMDRAKSEKVDLVLTVLHTPGGRSDYMDRICDAFLQTTTLPAERIPVVCFINTDAFSAGAFIAMSCNRIYIAPNGKIGAATGIFIQNGVPVELPESVEKKFASAFMGKVRALALVNGYPPDIAMAMVDRMQGVTEVEIDGKREYLSDKEMENRRRELGVGDMSLAEAQKRFRIVKTICEKGDLLTLDFQEAKQVGLAADVLDSKEAVLQELGLKNPVILTAEHVWSEHVFGFLASPGIRGILLLLGLMGLYFEFKVPGLGVPLVIGISCLALFFFSQYFMGLANYTGVILFIVGLTLVLIEIFLLPGFGIPGIMGIVLILGGVFLGMQPWVIPDIHNPLDMDIFVTNIIILGLVLMAMAVFVVVLAKFLPSTPLLRRIILASTGPAGELRSSGTLEESEKMLTGTKGKALSRLRPAGRAAFGEKILDVVTEGQFIEEGTVIEVLSVEGNRVVVRKSE